ncbi:hypothetical protein ACFYWP_36985 [Actinacidiphila glaucinigra]|uniref:hypothetical protein n=1 Tax=Actinacidiphila glaucinigra TaxID=235986 RepID=UPI00367FBB17
MTMERVLTAGAFGPYAGTLGSASLRQRAALQRAPLSLDASGLIIRAFRGDRRADPAVLAVREQGYVLGDAPVRGWRAVSAPLWSERWVAGSVTLLIPAQDAQRQSDPRLVHAVHELMDSAGVISRHLTRIETRHAG